MLAWFVTSSVLILAVVALRYALRGRISLRVQYALWAPVLVRLLLPCSLFPAAFSIMNPINRLSAAIASAGEGTTPVIKQGTDPAFLTVWLAGVAVFGLFYLIANFRFFRKLHKERSPLYIANSKLPVYLVEQVESSCLCGLVPPAIYTTLDCVENKELFPYIVVHETIHYRHLDHIWNLLRGLCLVLHWYNPLVWWAACLSKRDSELACDETTIARIGEAGRAAYARAMVEKTTIRFPSLFLGATLMNGSPESVKERIRLNAKKLNTPKPILIAIIIVAVLLVASTFTGPTVPAMEAQTETEPVIVIELTPAAAFRTLYQESDGVTLGLSLADDDSRPTYALTDSNRFAELIDSYHWTLQESPEKTNGEDCLIIADQSGHKTMTFCGTFLTYVNGELRYYWKAADSATSPARALRAEYDALDASLDRIVFDADNAGAAANAFIDSEYAAYRMSLDPASADYITDYAAIDREISEISDNASTVTGSFHYAVRAETADGPEDDTPLDSGKYAGMYPGFLEFKLQKQADGRWQCVELTAGSDVQ